MPTNSTVYLPPPLDSNEFQEICCDIWRRLWNDPYAQQNGRRGQGQDGVDVIGHPNQGRDVEGVQCKVRNYLLGQTLSYSEVLQAVKEATDFEPTLSKLIIATTAPTDARLQEDVRALADERREAGLFAVQVVFWGFIQGRLADEPSLRAKHYPTIHGGHRGSDENVDLSGYLRRFCGLLAQDLPPLLPLALTSEHQDRPVAGVVDTLRDRQIACLIGDSGVGKTHLAKHVAIELAQRGIVAILAAAKHYDGNLSHLLDRSVGHLIPASHQSLLETAANQGGEVVLVVDALNECADALRPALMEELAALRLSNPVGLLITSRPKVLPNLPGAQFCVEPPSAENKARLIDHYGPIPADFARLVRSPLDIRIAAEATSHLSQADPTTYDVFHAYCRGRLSERPHLGMRLLAALAARMAETLTWSLAEADVHRLAAEIAGEAAASVLTGACTSGLFEMDLGLGTFWHERIRSFFLAESILSTHPSPDELRSALTKPRNEDAVDFVIASARQIAEINVCLSTVDSTSQFSLILDGGLGTKAKTALIEAARGLLQRAHDDLAELVVHRVDPSQATAVPLELRTSTTWSDYDFRLMGVIGDAFKQGFFLDEVVALLTATERECLQRSDLPTAKAWRMLFPALYVFSSPRDLPAGRIAQAIGRDWHPSWSEQTRAFIGRMFDRLTELSPGELNLLLSYLHRTQDYRGKLIPILQRSWATGIYHLRLEAANAANTAALYLEDSAERDALKRLVESFLGNNPVLNSALVETLAQFEDLGLTSAERAREEVRFVLSEPRTPEICKQAAGIFSNQFEEVLGSHHYDAIEELQADEWLSFHLMAALGSTADDFGVNLILTRLVQRPSPQSEDVFLKFALPPPSTRVFLNGPPTTFRLAYAGLARICATPPAPPAPRNADEASWHHWGTILFWSQKPDTPEATARAGCEVAWSRLSTDLLRAAVDPLFQMERYGGSSSVPFKPIEHLFPGELKKLLEHSLPLRAELTSINSGDGNRLHGDRINFIINKLAVIGDEVSLPVLEPLCDSSGHGRAAVQAVKAIQERIIGARRALRQPKRM